MDAALKILNLNLFEEFKPSIQFDISEKLNSLKDIELPFHTNHYEASESTYSSNIEGNSISLDSFLKYTSTKAFKETKEINELILAYQFAKKSELTKTNFFKVHKILSKSFLIPSAQGKLRKGNVVIGGKSGIVYAVIDNINLKKEFDVFFKHIETLLKLTLTTEHVFYFASQIHLVFEKIYPFNVGNGRAGRLLEKWFLSTFIKEKARRIESEKFYFENRNEYYKNLSIGFDYELCDLIKALPFLLMLPNALKHV